MKKTSYEGRTYTTDGYTISIWKGTQKLGTLLDETVKVADLDQVLGMNDLIEYTVKSNAELDGVDEVNTFALISAGLCPILAGWEDGEGNALSLEGWGEYAPVKDLEDLEEVAREEAKTFLTYMDRWGEYTGYEEQEELTEYLTQETHLLGESKEYTREQMSQALDSHTPDFLEQLHDKVYNLMMESENDTEGYLALANRLDKITENLEQRA